MSDDLIFGKQKIESWKSGIAHEITFIVTEDCNLRCKYCYISDKADERVMSFDVAKKAVDYILENPKLFASPSVVWTFIGGEPLMEIELIDRIVDYIKVRTYELNHIWFSSYRISISTNGVLYSDEKVQNFIRKNHQKLSIGISVDGTQRKHDLQRVFPDGRGSYDDVMKSVPLWREQFPEGLTKVTIGSDDIPFLYESIVHLWDLGMKIIPANVVFEDVWKDGDDLLFEEQLKKIADYVIEKKIWNTHSCTLFDETIGKPGNKTTLCRNYCGTGKMLAVDYDGKLYPCLRFKSYSLEDKPPYIIGDIEKGIDFDRVRPFYGLDAYVQSPEECIECEISTGCAWCQGNNYNYAETDTLFYRATFICKMHKARVRANNYFWEKIKNHADYERVYSKKKHLYFILSDDSVEFCNYESEKESKNLMSIDTFDKGMEFALENFFRPVLLHSRSNENEIYDKRYENRDKINIYGIKDKISSKSKGFPVFESGDLEGKIEEVGAGCILNIRKEEVNKLDIMIKKLLKKFDRININYIFSSRDIDLDMYKEKMINIKEELIKYYEKGLFKEVNKITDILLVDEMDNCNFGKDNFAMGPNGKIYICPAYYFNDPNDCIGTIDKVAKNGEIKFFGQELLNIDKSKFCKKCEEYHCDRCSFLSRKFTGEYSVPSSIQCKLSIIEHNVSAELLKDMENRKLDSKLFRDIESVQVHDYIDRVIKETDTNPYNFSNDIGGC